MDYHARTSDSVDDAEAMKISYDLLKTITDDFSVERCVGVGSFGAVYKGTHADGKEIAVKLLKNINIFLDDKTFSNEFQTLAKLKHQNIIQLLGYCKEAEERLVEYEGRQVIADKLHVAICLEYAEKGSLHKYISSDEDDGLEWHIRYKIIKGICEGLKYLREGSHNPTLWHLDLKPDNILLDNEMMPKIADFGLSRFVCDKATRKTASPIGTIGYLPQEYLERQMVSSSFDIFSLGVIITRIMIGTQGYHRFADLAHEQLVKRVRNYWKKRLQGIVSPRLLHAYCQQVKECISIASKCLNKDRHQRPDIQKIILTLNQTETRIEKVSNPMTRRYSFLENLFVKGVVFAMGLYIILLVSMEINSNNNRPQLRNSADTNQLCHAEWASSSGSSRFKQFDSSIHMLGKPARGHLQEFSRSLYSNLISYSDAPQNGYGEMPKRASKVLKEIPYKLLKTITGDFSKLLGSGTLRTVFKGVDDNRQVTAVKIFNEYLGAKIVMQLQNEIRIAMGFEVEHENIIQPVGYCLENEEVVAQYNEKMYITYPTHAAICLEYMENGSLREHISDASEGLDWCTRYKIIKGICDGLRYLHERLHNPVLHLNLKPSNILLDENMVPKISDFSLSTRLGEEDTRMIEPNVGTLTYMPPEFINKLVISTEFDIFSLGVIIIETVAGFSIYKLLHDMPNEEIIELVLAKWTNRLQAMLTPQSVERYCGQVRTCIQMALRCVDPDRHNRPSIGEVVAVLEATEPWVHDGSALLDVHPMELCFPFMPRSHGSCLLHLHNGGDDRVEFRLEPKTPTNSRYKNLPLCGIVPPRCSYTLALTTKKLPRQPPTWDAHDDGFMLRINATCRDPETQLQDLETAGDEVQEVALKSFCVPLAEEPSSSEVTRRSEIEIIASPNARHVSSIEIHPTKPWIMTAHRRGNLRIWNYNTMQVVISSFEVTDKPVCVAKFIVREQWIVGGDDNGYIHVCSYTKSDAASFKAHNGRIMTLAVHPTDSYVLSSSCDDHLIKLWHWDKNWNFKTDCWVCTRTFEGHSDKVSQIIFNQMNTGSFASASWDCVVKIWDLNSDECNTITLDKNPKGPLCIDYISAADREHLITGSKDGTAKIWDLKTKSCIHNLNGHTDAISTVYCRPEVRELLTGSLDGTVRIWDSTTYRLQNVIAFKLGAVYDIGYIEELQRIVVGCKMGIAMMETKISVKTQMPEKENVVTSTVM